MHENEIVTQKEKVPSGWACVLPILLRLSSLNFSPPQIAPFSFCWYIFFSNFLHPFLLAIRPSQKFGFPSLQYQHCQYPRLLTMSLVCRSHSQCGISHSHPSPIPLFPSCHAISRSHAKATGTAQNPGKRGGNRLTGGHVLNAIVWSIICRMLVN